MKENLLDKYLKEKNIKPSQFARMMKANPASVHSWTHGKTKPRAETAWKIHKATKGHVPITYWGIVIINGKMKKIDDAEIAV